MLEKIKTMTIDYAKSLGDIRVIGQTVFVIVVLMVSWSAIKSIQTNYDLQKKIARLEQEIKVQELENQNLALENQYLETDQFIELAVRRQFGRAAPGERVYLVPSDVAATYAPNIEKQEQNKEAEKEKPTYQKNLEAWSNFFFRKSNNRLIEG